MPSAVQERMAAKPDRCDTGEREPSSDVEGRNTDKLDRIYAWEAAA